MKKVFLIVCICIFAAIAGGCQSSPAATQTKDAVYKVSIVDDSGKNISLKTPAVKIISLYSAHTENLFALGLDKEIIGVSTAESYPPEAKDKPVFDYRADPEKVIAAEPDLVLIRPFVRQGYPNFVKALENAGIIVVTLYPEKFEEFDEYIQKLAILTGKQEIANKKLSEFHRQLDEIEKITSKAKAKKTVYFESVETNYRTVTPDCMAAKLLAIAGAVNAANDVAPIRKGSSIAPYGDERLLSKAEEIDVFVAQAGVMNPGVTVEKVRNRAGFDKIKAIQNNEVYIIDEKLVSSPTFRLAAGAKELAQMVYPDLFSK